MRKSTLESNNITEETISLINNHVTRIPWPERRAAMGETTLVLLSGSSRLAESVFGWSRKAVKLGINEFQSGIRCIDDIGTRRRNKTEENSPQLLVDIKKIIDPHSHADCQLRSDLAHSNITAQAVHDALLQNGWTKKDLPTVRTISNILNRHGYRVRSVAKTKVQKKH
jgi:hypothetical protein